MFGYIRPITETLSDDDQKVYRALYCSLCDELRRFGFGVKLFLNYDFVFAALLLQCSTEGEATPTEIRCNTNPLKKVGHLDDPILRRIAAALILVCRYKLLDDSTDERFPRKLASALLYALTAPAGRRASRMIPELPSVLDDQMAQQKALEQDGCDSFDRAADPSAVGLSFLLDSLVQDPSLRAVYKRMGYLLGRFVYLADAADDLEDDLKYSRYNPAILRHALSKNSSLETKETAREELRELMRQTAAHIELCWRLVPAKRFRSILNAILYAGLSHTIETVGTVKERKEKQ